MASLNLRDWPTFEARWLQYLSPRIDDQQVHAAFRGAKQQLAASAATVAEESKNEPINPPGELYWKHAEALATALRDMHERSEVLLAKRSRWSRFHRRDRA